VNDENSSTNDFTPGMLSETGKNAPAPWVAYTRAGCDFGAFAADNVVVERTPFDVVKIFGPCTTANPQAPACEDFPYTFIDRGFPFEKIVETARYMESNEQIAKIVVQA